MDEVEENNQYFNMFFSCELTIWTQNVLQVQKEMWISSVYDTQP